MYKFILRKIFFLFKPEFIHFVVIVLLKIPFISKIFKLFFYFEHSSLNINLFGIEFKNPVGVAAGFDKNAECYNQLADLGFSFIEIGTVTPKPQEGNPKPRLFRLPKDEALINRMGFNNDGIIEVKERLNNKKRKLVVAGNIGKNKGTPNQEAKSDYEICFNTLYDYVDFFVVNVSSPNTPNLRELQDKEPLRKLLQHLKILNTKREKGKPILLKIAPDLTNNQLDDILEIVKEVKLDGIVATNTTISRENLLTPAEEITRIGEGGLSGKPLAKRSTEIIKYIFQKTGGKLTIIGAGGIHTPEDAVEKLEAGARLIELYTGFIYEGPGIVRRINKMLAERSATN